MDLVAPQLDPEIGARRCELRQDTFQMSLEFIGVVVSMFVTTTLGKLYSGRSYRGSDLGT